MRPEVFQYIQQNTELHRFLRIHPSWYRKLSRDPSMLSQMEKEAKVFYGKTFPQRMDRLQNNMSMAMMLLEMMKNFKPN
ncbi:MULTISPECIES: YlbE-like family protein [Bacillaceae]|uniref:YlbE-like family protein n=1 Tax=Evansella alkalicola TaxID=745819 RepID=A0ABS6JPI5_9BACI|nr:MULTISPECIES: YlbE-like family protein [Bacillaceae]MBU9720471.1 YlbE-like family protein [Bacillus alkalicola]